MQSLRFGERCGMISNHTVQASASMASAMAAVNAALGELPLCVQKFSHPPLPS